jgi:hypothetical protein
VTVVIEADNPGDIITATVRLAERAGARSWELAYACPHTPGEGPGHTCPDVEWTCTVEYRGIKVFESAPTPHEAAVALAVRLMTGAMCRCRRPVTLNERTEAAQCRWTFEGDQWVPGCDAPAIAVPGGSPGDYQAIRDAMAAPRPSRAERRAAERGKRRDPRGY